MSEYTAITATVGDGITGHTSQTFNCLFTQVSYQR